MKVQSVNYHPQLNVIHVTAGHKKFEPAFTLSIESDG
jgi:hypothetical protein